METGHKRASDWQDLLRIAQGSPLVIERVRIPEKGISVEGEFTLPELARLSLEDQVFVVAFLRSHGSIKEMEQTFGVSYPTIKARLNRISSQLEFVETNPVPVACRDPGPSQQRRNHRGRSNPRIGGTQMTPNIAVLEIQSPHWRMPRLWLPLFLLWIPLILLSPLIFLVLFGLCLAGGISPWRAIQVFWAISLSLPGTHIHVSTHESKVLVRIL